MDYGALVDATNGAGQTPLHIAAAEGDEPLVKYFYGVRANAAIADNEGNSNLRSDCGQFSLVNLVEKNCSVNKNFPLVMSEIKASLPLATIYKLYHQDIFIKSSMLLLISVSQMFWKHGLKKDCEV